MPAKKSSSKKSAKKKPIYKRILLKISGESLSGPQGYGIHGQTLESIARELKEVHELGVEIAVAVKVASRDHGAFDYTPYLGVVLLAVALVFVWRSFYAMRIPPKVEEGPAVATRGAHGTDDRITAGMH